MANILVDDFRALMANMGEQQKVAEAKAEIMSGVLVDLLCVVQRSSGVTNYRVCGNVREWDKLDLTEERILAAIDTDNARAHLTRLFSTEAENSRLKQENRSLRMHNKQLQDQLTELQMLSFGNTIEANSEIDKLRARIAELEARPSSLTVAARMASLEGKTLSGAGVVAAVLAGASNSAEPALSTKHSIGYVEGDLCNRDGCEGTIVFNERRNCSCHLGNAPCSGCELRGLVCDECGVFPSEEDL